MVNKTGQNEGHRAIARQCRHRGLQVERVERKGTVLVLHPEPGTTLPEASELTQIAGEVEIPGIRYVTVDLAAFATQDRYQGEVGDE